MVILLLRLLRFLKVIILHTVRTFWQSTYRVVVMYMLHAWLDYIAWKLFVSRFRNCDTNIDCFGVPTQ